MRLGWPIIGLVVLIGMAGFWLLSDIARDQDEAYQQSTHNFVGQSMNALAKANSIVTAEYSVWDDAFANVTLDENDPWMVTNFVALSTSSIGIFRPSKGVRYLYIAPNYEGTRASLQDAMPAFVADRGLFFDPLARNAKTVKLGQKLLLVGGRLAAVTVQIVQPELGSKLTSAFKASPKDYMVSVTYIGDENIKAIATSFGLKDARLHMGPMPKLKDESRVYYQVNNYQGHPIAWIDWAHARPGSTAFEKRIIPITLGLLLAAILAIIISQKIVTANLNLITKARLAEEANRTKSNFLANVSHELRTPLNTIIGYSEMIEEECVDTGQSQTARDAKKVTNSAQHLLALINDLLDHSKIEAGKMDLNPAPIQMSTLLVSVADAVQSQIGKNANQLVLNFEPELGTAIIDAMRVKQCLLNLLSNAAKFTSNGTITLSAASEVIGGVDMIVLSVADTGLGMSLETIAKLFSPFVQANEKVAAKFGGTGLGLVITKALIVAMGGNIQVTSVKDVGTAFTITVPRSTVAYVAHPSVSSPPAALAA
jgi:signal transduction histidine kinase